ncbi:MAG: hypothetical protein GY913_33815 [Proteobacteria bacterium]|nr:hypothetical protein [Pseudomonadota bacterium]
MPEPIRHPTGIIGGGGGSSGAAWVVASTLDWSAEPAVDLKVAGSLVDANGDTWTAANGGNASTLGTDGATGLRIVVSSNCGIAVNTCPEVSTGLAGLVSGVANDDEVYVLLRVTHPTASGNSRLGPSLRVSGANMHAGAWYVASPGRLEWGGVSNASQYADPSTATPGDTDQVVGVRYTSGAYQIYTHGAWSGTWPTDPSSGTFVIGDGESSGNPKTATTILLASASLVLLGLRGAAPNPDLTIIAHRILHRASA